MELLWYREERSQRPNETKVYQVQLTELEARKQYTEQKHNPAQTGHPQGSWA